MTPHTGTLKRRRSKTGASSTPDRATGLELHQRTSSTTISLLSDQDYETADDDFKVSLVARGIKRTFDIVASLALLVALAPVLAALAILIRMDSPGPAIFAHRRLGRGGRHFDCYKFRSMLQDAEHLLHADERLRHQYVTNHFKIPMAIDPRVTALGRFLRRSSLDELPQLWNVLTGDMSLVGPRPIVALEGSYYGDRLSDLLSVRPGITGSWAVHGRSKIGYPDRVEVELSYLEQWSLLSDFNILARTPWTVITQRGAL